MRKGGEGRFCVNCPDYLRLTRKNACRGKIQGFDVIDCWHVGRHLLGWIQSAAAFVSSRGGLGLGFSASLFNFALRQHQHHNRFTMLCFFTTVTASKTLYTFA